MMPHVHLKCHSNLKACGSKSPFRDQGPLEIEEARLLDSLIMIGTRMTLGWCHGVPLRATGMTLRMTKSGPSQFVFLHLFQGTPHQPTVQKSLG